MGKTNPSVVRTSTLPTRRLAAEVLADFAKLVGMTNVCKKETGDSPDTCLADGNGVLFFTPGPNQRKWATVILDYDTNRATVSMDCLKDFIRPRGHKRFFPDELIVEIPDFDPRAPVCVSIDMTDAQARVEARKHIPQTSPPEPHRPRPGSGGQGYYIEVQAMTYDETKAAYLEALDRCNPRQRLFAEHLVDGKSQAEAARQAGYAKCSVCWTTRMIRIDYVAKAVELGRSLASMGAATTAEWVRSQLRLIAEGALQDGERGNATAALKELSKIDGHYAPEKKEVTANVKVDSADDLHQDEIAALAALRHHDQHTSH